MPNETAPGGYVFVCTVCGKMSKDRYGYKSISKEWDESCILNCQLVKEDTLIIKNGRVVSVKV